MSKLLERIAYAQRTAHPELNSAFPEYQNVYRIMLFSKLYSDLNMAIGKGHAALIGFMDLTAAFDTVDHDMILKGIKVSFGVCSTRIPLKKMKSYVTDRTKTAIEIVDC